MLTDGQVDALHKRGIDLPAACCQHLLDSFHRPEDHTMLDGHEAPAPVRLHHPRLEQPGPRHPARLGRWTFGLAAWRLHPVPIMGQQGCHVLAKAIGEKQWGAVRGHDLRDMMDHTLCHGERPITDVDREQQLALWVHRYPDPMGGMLQAVNGLGRADFARLHRTEHGKEFVQLDLRDAHVVQEIPRKGGGVVGDCKKPGERRVRVHLEHGGDRAIAQAFRQCTHDPCEHIGRYPLAMQRGTMRLLEIAMARHTLELPPWLAPGMAMGADVAATSPAIIGAVLGGAELLLSIDRAVPAPREGEPGWRGTGRLRTRLGGMLTGVAQRLVEESGKGFGLLGAFLDRLGR
jgi:hypothetical protein